MPPKAVRASQAQGTYWIVIPSHRPHTTVGPKQVPLVWTEWLIQRVTREDQPGGQQDVLSLCTDVATLDENVSVEIEQGKTKLDRTRREKRSGMRKAGKSLSCPEGHGHRGHLLEEQEYMGIPFLNIGVKFGLEKNPGDSRPTPQCRGDGTEAGRQESRDEEEPSSDLGLYTRSSRGPISHLDFNSVLPLPKATPSPSLSLCMQKPVSPS